MESRVVLVTGAGRNLGRAIALTFAASGADLVLNTRSGLDSIESVAEEIREHGQRALPILADVAEEEQVETMVHAALAYFGRIDILVNNAGPRDESPIEALTSARWQAVVRPILDGAFFCCRAVLPGMRARRWGRVINILGSIAHCGQAHRVHLAAAKAGVLGLTRALAAEVSRDGVTINAISPGVLATELNNGLDSAVRTRRVEANPLPRLGLPEEVAGLCVYLASDRAAFITGQAIAINGGEVMLG